MLLRKKSSYANNKNKKYTGTVYGISNKFEVSESRLYVIVPIKGFVYCK